MWDEKTSIQKEIKVDSTKYQKNGAGFVGKSHRQEKEKRQESICK